MYRDREPPRKVIATGWGEIDNNFRRPAILQKVNLVFFSRTQCEKTWGKSLKRRYKDKLITSQVCYGDKTNKNRDTCRGDSGGPIQIKVSNKRYEIVGVTSLGSSLCGSGPPGGYSSVTFYLPWIKFHIKSKKFI